MGHLFRSFSSIWIHVATMDGCSSHGIKQRLGRDIFITAQNVQVFPDLQKYSFCIAAMLKSLVCEKRCSPISESLPLALCTLLSIKNMRELSKQDDSRWAHYHVKTPCLVMLIASAAKQLCRYELTVDWTILECSAPVRACPSYLVKWVQFWGPHPVLSVELGVKERGNRFHSAQSAGVLPPSPFRSSTC